FLISSLVILFLIKESFHNSDRGRFNIKDFVPIIKHPLIILASLASFSLMVSNGTLAFALPLNVEVMEKGTETTGILLSTFGIVALIVFMTPLHKIYDRFKAVQLIALGLFLIGIGMVILSVSQCLAVTLSQ